MNKNQNRIYDDINKGQTYWTSATVGEKRAIRTNSFTRMKFRRIIKRLLRQCSK